MPFVQGPVLLVEFEPPAPAPPAPAPPVAGLVLVTQRSVVALQMSPTWQAPTNAPELIHGQFLSPSTQVEEVAAPPPVPALAPPAPALPPPSTTAPPVFPAPPSAGEPPTPTAPPVPEPVSSSPEFEPELQADATTKMKYEVIDSIDAGSKRVVMDITLFVSGAAKAARG